MRKDLLDLSKAIAAGIDHRDVMALSGTSADLQTKEYQYLKIGMERMHRAVSRSRFAYLLGMRDGQVVIYVDSEPLESPDYSEPGSVYYEAPEAIAKNFPFGQSFVVGPYTDRWGMWISGYSPIIDPDTGVIHAYVGLDVSESAWSREVLLQQALVSIITFLAVVAFLGGMLLKDNRRFFFDAARSETERLRNILEQLPVGILTANASSRTFAFANKKALELLGHEYIEIGGRKAEKFEEHRFQNLNGEPIPFEELPLVETLRTGVAVKNKDISFKRMDGTRMIARVETVPLFKEGTLTSVLMLFEDITKEKELEHMRSEFVSIASHQLRTPATMIRWLSEVLLEDRDSNLDPTQKAYLQQIHEGNQRMIALITDLLDVSRTENGKGLVMTKVRGDLVEVIASVLLELKPSAGEKGVRIKKASGFPKNLPATFDPVKIKQVFQNLLENAVKYSNKGGDIVLACDTSRPKEYVFSVKDEGIGIPLAEQSRIFVGFFRASNASLIANSGTGLGLYIAKALVENHGGRIWFVSEENKGTTFLFSIPR